MRSRTLAGAALLMGSLLAGCGAESDPTAVNAPGLLADATPVHSEQEFALDDTYVNPCNGETVHLTGTLVGLMNDVDNLHLEFHAVISETGTGLTTGALYTSHSTYSEQFNSPSEPAVNVTFHYRDAVHINSSTPGLSFTLLNTLFFVQTPSGEFKFTKEIESATCRG